MLPSSGFSLCMEGEKREGYGHPVLMMCKVCKKEDKWEQMNSELKEWVMETVRLDAIVQDTSPDKSSGPRLTRQDFSQGEESRVIGHKAGREEQGWVLLVQFSQLLLQLHMKLTGTWDVASTTSSSSMTLQGLPSQAKTTATKKNKQNSTQEEDEIFCQTLKNWVGFSSLMGINIDLVILCKLCPMWPSRGQDGDYRETWALLLRPKAPRDGRRS